MGVGPPLPDEVLEELRQLVRRAVGAELYDAMQVRQREVHEMLEGMTDEQRVAWFLGEPIPPARESYPPWGR